MSMRKICVVTGSRAEYGLLYWLMKEIEQDDGLKLQIVVTGMHLSPEFGSTYQKIKEDGFVIDKKVEMLLSSDSTIGVSKSMGLAQISFSEVFDELNPDILVVLGDRTEIFSVVSSAMVLNLAIAHISGGELTLGAIDDSIRHAITKMSHLHFVATEEYRRRVLQMGEMPGRVFNFGESGIDNIYKLPLLNKSDFEMSINWTLKDKSIVFTYHSVTLDPPNKQENDIFCILNFLSNLNDTSVIMTKSNSDSGGRFINAMLEKYENRYLHMKLFDSLGQVRYLSALKHVDAVVGNTSSGLVEAPSFNIGSINIGDRQMGRVKAESVIDCRAKTLSLATAFNKLYSDEFKSTLKGVVNPYGTGGGSLKIKEVLKKVNLNQLTFKEFVDY
jgi:GDP/UDP-N,N'-diacetylbacillosamine 2-epimerase (hydrolysing)